MATRKKTSLQRLQETEETTFDRAVALDKNFEKTGNYKALQHAAQQFRVCMQAMRDKSRYRLTKGK